jgi:hypothetical protein
MYGRADGILSGAKAAEVCLFGAHRPANGAEHRPANGAEHRPANGDEHRPANGAEHRPANGADAATGVDDLSDCAVDGDSTSADEPFDIGTAATPLSMPASSPSPLDTAAPPLSANLTVAAAAREATGNSKARLAAPATESGAGVMAAAGSTPTTCGAAGAEHSDPATPLSGCGVGAGSRELEQLKNRPITADGRRRLAAAPQQTFPWETLRTPAEAEAYYTALRKQTHTPATVARMFPPLEDDDLGVTVGIDREFRPLLDTSDGDASSEDETDDETDDETKNEADDETKEKAAARSTSGMGSGYSASGAVYGAVALAAAGQLSDRQVRRRVRKRAAAAREHLIRRARAQAAAAAALFATKRRPVAADVARLKSDEGCSSDMVAVGAGLQTAEGDRCNDGNPRSADINTSAPTPDATPAAVVSRHGDQEGQHGTPSPPPPPASPAGSLPGSGARRNVDGGTATSEVQMPAPEMPPAAKRAEGDATASGTTRQQEKEATGGNSAAPLPPESVAVAEVIAATAATATATTSAAAATAATASAATLARKAAAAARTPAASAAGTATAAAVTAATSSPAAGSNSNGANEHGHNGASACVAVGAESHAELFRRLAASPDQDAASGRPARRSRRVQPIREEIVEMAQRLSCKGGQGEEHLLSLNLGWRCCLCSLHALCCTHLLAGLWVPCPSPSRALGRVCGFHALRPFGPLGRIVGSMHFAFSCPLAGLSFLCFSPSRALGWGCRFCAFRHLRVCCNS